MYRDIFGEGKNLKDKCNRPFYRLLKEYGNRLGFGHLTGCSKCKRKLVKDINSYTKGIENIKQSNKFPLYIEGLETLLRPIKFENLDNHGKTLYRILDGLRYTYYNGPISIDNDFYHECFNKQDPAYQEDFEEHISYYDFDKIISFILENHGIKSIKEENLIEKG